MASDDTFTAEVPKEVIETDAYRAWADAITGTDLEKAEAAIEKIENEGVITSAKSLEDGLYEKKWKSGLRLYFAVVKGEKGKNTLLVLGSGKGAAQNKAIKESRKLLETYTVVPGSIKKKD
jgi:putative component of toxin-antitoxin plasmid stabilization module